MKSAVSIRQDSLRFFFPDHTAELQRRVGAWFAERLGELREPLRALVAQRLLLHPCDADLRESIRVEFTLNFQRTLRVPDDGRDYPLPAGLGRLPLRAPRHRARQAAPVETGREPFAALVPLHPAEATWLSFSRRHAFAVQVAAGGICAASGRPHVPALSRSPQNYLSVPTQPWLDGFRVDPHTVRQFVAMPLGHGYTVEGQVTGEERRGGVQLRVVPLTVDTLWTNDVLPACEARWRFLTRPVDARDDLLEERFSGALEEIELQACCLGGAVGMGAGGRIRQEVYADPHPREEWDESAALAAEVRLVPAAEWPSLTGEPVPTKPPTPELYADAGIPWFDYETPTAPVLEPSPLAGIKSANTLFKAKSGMDLPGNDLVPTTPKVKLTPGV